MRVLVLTTAQSPPPLSPPPLSPAPKLTKCSRKHPCVLERDNVAASRIPTLDYL